MPDEDSITYVPDEDGPELALPPALPAKPYTAEESEMLLDEVMEIFSDPHEALEELLECGSEIFDDVEELLADRFTADQFSLLLPILIQISFAFAPPNTLQPELDLDVMEKSFLDLLNGDAKDVHKLIAESKQPHLLESALARLRDFNTNIAPKKERLNPALFQIAQALLRVVVDAFDAALRQPGAARA